MTKLNIVGEVHLTRKQYPDVPPSRLVIQRTAFIGVEGEIQLRHKRSWVILLSLEEVPS
jgi:glutamyl-tRNA(Gln) amidotransferase subunit E